MAREGGRDRDAARAAIGAARWLHTGLPCSRRATAWERAASRPDRGARAGSVLYTWDRAAVAVERTDAVRGPAYDRHERAASP